MSFGVVMLVHTALDRAEQIAKHWAAGGSPVVIHVDKQVSQKRFASFQAAIADCENVSLSQRVKCEWGTWSLVEAAQIASQLLLDKHPDIEHVFLASGSCLPLRPVQELKHFLLRHPTTNFIESVNTHDVTWTVGGLSYERFLLRFPFSWRKHRKLFDLYVELQRALRFSRRIPERIVPHLGSQWWCLTRNTLSKILNDPNRKKYDTYFKKVWIPDESYFQTLVRLHSDDIQSRSLTLSKFDYHGKPYTFYDDHLQLLRRTDCFVARKIWRKADKLYKTFLHEPTDYIKAGEPNAGKIDRIFAKAVERRILGREGLYMQSRFPIHKQYSAKSYDDYSIFEGFSEIFVNFEQWLAQVTGLRVHGHLFAPQKAEFSENKNIFAGNLSSNARLRDYNPSGFLQSLIWNTRGEKQCFQFGPRDNQKISEYLAQDKCAHIYVITGAWAMPLYRTGKDFDDIRKEAAKLQKIEQDHLQILKQKDASAQVSHWSLAEFVEDPLPILQKIIDQVGPRNIRRLSEAPEMHDLTDFDKFLFKLKNKGMDPHLIGEFLPQPMKENPAIQRPYLVSQNAKNI